MVVEALAGHKTVNEIASAYEIHPSQVAKWKAEALERLPKVLSDGRKVKADSGRETEARLYEEIGRLRMEVEYLKKKAGTLPLEQRRGMITSEGCDLSVREQCRLLGVPNGAEHRVYPYLLRGLRIDRPNQGSQFTSAGWLAELTKAGIAISMGGRGRVFDNIFTERLWRSVKYEDVYLKDYGAADEARQGFGGYFGFYNRDRPHQALGYRTPAEVHFGVGGRQGNDVTGRNKKEKEAKRKKMLLLQNTTLKT